MTRNGHKKNGLPVQDRKAAKLDLFRDAWLANGQHAGEAAKAAGYRGTKASLQTIGCRLLAQCRAEGLIEERLAQVRGAMGAEEVLERLSAIARGDMEQWPEIKAELHAILDALKTLAKIHELEGREAPAKDLDMALLLANLPSDALRSVLETIRAMKAKEVAH